MRPAHANATRRWVVATAYSGMNLFDLVMNTAAGVVYVNMVEYFGVSREEAAWPISALPVSANLVGKRARQQPSVF